MSLSEKLWNKTPINVVVALCVIGVEGMIGIDVGFGLFLCALAGAYSSDVFNHLMSH